MTIVCKSSLERLKNKTHTLNLFSRNQKKKSTHTIQYKTTRKLWALCNCFDTELEKVECANSLQYIHIKCIYIYMAKKCMHRWWSVVVGTKWRWNSARQKEKSVWTSGFMSKWFYESDFLCKYWERTMIFFKLQISHDDKTCANKRWYNNDEDTEDDDDEAHIRGRCLIVTLNDEWWTTIDMRQYVMILYDIWW